MSTTQLLEGWIFPALLLLLPGWTWYAKRHRLEKTRAKADAFLKGVREAVTAAIGTDPAPPGSAVEEVVRRWYAAATLALLGNLFIAGVLAYFLLKIWVFADPRRAAKDPVPPIPDLPSAKVVALSAFHLLFIALLVVGATRFLDKAFIRPVAPNLPSASPESAPLHRHQAPTTQPVVRVLEAAGDCAMALQRHQPGVAPQGAAISIRGAEKAVYQAWRASGRLPRRWQHLDARKHAQHVVAALRFEERQQHIEPENALIELVQMLTKIAGRMADGRYLQLLDKPDLEKGQSVRTYPMVRLLVSGGLLLGLLGLGTWAGVPEVLLVPMLALAAAVVVPVAFRVPVPGAAFVTSLFQRP
ncbi:hypothetical protein [Streptomyces sp. NPDC002530]